MQPETEKQQKAQKLSPVSRILLVLLALLVALPVGGWLLRKPIAKQAALAYCAQRDLYCAGSIKALSITRLQINDLVVQTEAGTPFEAKSITVGYTWPSLTRPQASYIRAHRPVLRARVLDGELDLYDVVLRASGNSSSEPVELPQFDMTDGRIELETDAGTVIGRVEATGTSAQSINLDVAIEATQLQQGTNRVDVAESQATVVVEGDHVHGSGRIDIRKVELEGVYLDETVLEFDASQIETGVRVNWIGAIEAAEHALAGATQLTTEGAITFDSRDDGNLSLETLETLVGTLEARAVRLGTSGVENVTLDMDLGQSSNGLEGQTAIQLENLSHSGVSVETGLIAGTVRVVTDPETGSEVEFSGGLSGQRIGLTEDVSARITRLLALPVPLAAHGRVLRNRLTTALADFDMGVDGSVSWNFDTGDYQLIVTRPTSLRAANGMTLTLQSGEGENWLSVSNTFAEVRGELSVSGGGLSSLQASLDEARLDRRTGKLTVDASRIWLLPWTVEGTTAEFRLDGLAALSGDDGLVVDGVGFVRLTGQLMDSVTTENLTIRGAVNSSQKDGLWQVVTAGDGCFAVAAAHITAFGYRWEQPDVQACPTGRRLFVSGDGGLTGQFALGTIQLPLSSASVTASLQSADTVFDWSRENGLTLSIASDGLSGQVFAADRTIDLKTGNGAIRLTETGRPAARMNGFFSEVESLVSGIPVGLSAPSISFSQDAATDTFTLDYQMQDARLRDPTDESLFKPLALTGAGQVDALRFTLNGDLSIAERGTRLGPLTIEHRFGEDAGTAEFRGLPLFFSPFGLQPVHLTERLRGVAVDASGVVSPTITAAWAEGDLTTGGTFGFSELGFSTFRLGSVQGVNGTLTFDNLIDIHTPPGQTLTIGSIGILPSLPLENGELSFQFLSPREVIIEGASWPFAEGRLYVSPTRWRRGGGSETILVNAENWNVGGLIDQLDIPNLSAEGILSGEFPIELDGAKASVRNALLTATGEGVVKYDGPISESAGQADDYAKLAFDAMRNFEYEVLSLGLDGDITDEMTLTIAVSGRNPDVLEGQAIDLTVNIESELAKLLGSGQSLMTPNAAIRDAIRVNSDRDAARQAQ